MTTQQSELVERLRGCMLQIVPKGGVPTNPISPLPYDAADTIESQASLIREAVEALDTANAALSHAYNATENPDHGRQYSDAIKVVRDCYARLKGEQQ